MPIEYKGKKYEFSTLVKKIKKSKPGIKSPGGYVKSIEEHQHLSQKIAALKKITESGKYKRGNPDTALIKEVPFGKENRTNEQIKATAVNQFVDRFGGVIDNSKLRLKKPTQRDRTRMIQARLDSLRDELEEKKISRLHEHQIVWRENPAGYTKTASLMDVTGKFVKYWLLNAKEINGNGWGVSPI
ncbi:MAG: hypothetical protein ACREAK_02080, partial [Nitrosarchaeum sp.]